MARSKLPGIARFRRLLRRLPDETRGELVVELSVTGRQIAQAMRAKAPHKTGALRSGISEKVLPRSLRLQVGLLGTRSGRSSLFYGRIQDLGRRAQVVLVQRRRRVSFEAGGRKLNALLTSRGRKRAEDVVATYRMKVKAMQPKRFITGRYPDLRSTLNANLRGIFGRALGRIAGGANE
ncbi:hypothetical protein [Sphingomonas immobilis]|uniref:HK97 gp10 family phage protein n=1 Tax=Sphingomonas immobilis TaxID=3063997 RepID=A0ABT9A0U6_9SPHN|nr:hypothetical protein [Sphingomonas sp. CA1-15]MDO7843451.1 hypothetical protein [Sphingomonas sp. CA1-15]